MPLDREAVYRIIEQVEADRVPLPDPPARRAIRTLAHWSQQQVAEALHTTQAAIARYEDGTREPSGPMRQAYGDLLEVLRRLR